MIKFEDCIKGNGEEMEVDWNVFKKVQESVNDKLYAEITKSLTEKGILSTKSKDNYGVLGNGILLNPKEMFFTLYFTNEEDAFEYGKTYKDCDYKAKPVKLLI